MNIPQDPYILLSFINTKLRDGHSNLEELCRDLGISYSNLQNVLSSIEYTYQKDINRFTPMIS